MPILLVDDNALSRELLGRALRQSGYTVRECADGESALERVRAGPMLLVLDYDMPQMSGAQVCARLRGSPDPAIATLPIILLTAYSGMEHELECLAAGASDFVGKPVNPEILEARIETQMRLYEIGSQLRMRNEELEQWRHLHEEDLDAARVTQQSMLPSHTPVLAGWQLAAYYRPFIQVGGDVYDWLKLRDGSWLVWIADATGHGAAAALLTSLTKLVFQHAATGTNLPHEILNAVNTEFYELLHGRAFLTAACLVVHPGSNKVEFAGAGHPPLLRAGAGAVESFKSQAPPIGVRAGLGCTQTVLDVDHGQELLLYTDGLYSMTDPESGQHLAPRDAPALLPPQASSADDFLAQTVAAISDRSHDQILPDDFAAIALYRE